MYFYQLYGYEDSQVLMHEKKFSEEEFERICNEVPKIHMGDMYYYNDSDVMRHLIEIYGFKDIEFQASLFTELQ